MSLDSVIKKIHESGLYGNFIEIGAGQPLSTALFSISGASKTINIAVSPYSRFSQHKYASNSNQANRTVSRENIRRILDIEYDENCNEKVNFFWASSFQLNEDPDYCSHGWIGYHAQEFASERWTREYFHITFPNGLDRKAMIDRLGQLSVKLLFNIHHQLNGGNDTEPLLKVDYVDGVFHHTKFGLGLTLDKTVNYLDQNGYFVIKPSSGISSINDQWERLETNFRLNTQDHINADINADTNMNSNANSEQEPLLIYKGSFNPLHEGHLGIIRQACERYPNSKLVLMISLNTYQKGTVNFQSLRSRIHEITQKNNFFLIICREPMYAENIQDLQWRLPGRKLVFLAGWDTYVRMEDSLFYNEVQDEVQFLIFDRNNQMHSANFRRRPNCKFVDYNQPISSTEIRKNYQNNQDNQDNKRKMSNNRKIDDDNNNNNNNNNKRMKLTNWEIFHGQSC